MLDLFPRRGWGRWSDDLLVLGAGSKSQSGEQNGHDHDLFQKFQIYLASFRSRLLSFV